LHALWTLEGLSALTKPGAESLKDSDAHIREHALALGRWLLAEVRRVLTDAAIGNGQRQRHARGNFQSAFTLGQLKDSRGLNALLTWPCNAATINGSGSRS
jgi:hypothetical protein